MLQPSVLICHHDPGYLALLGDYIRERDYTVYTTMDARQVLPMLAGHAIQLCLVDAMLSDQQAFDLTKSLRIHYPHLPVLMLSAAASREEQLTALRAGAVGYIPVPTDMEILLARMAVLIRLVAPDEEDMMPAVFQLGSVRFDGTNHRLGDRTLSVRESDLLLLLCRYKNKTVLRSHILRSIWANEDVFASRSLSVYINRLRHHLGPDSAVSILPVRGKGYMLTDKQ